MATMTMTTEQLAKRLGTNPRTVRRFLRAQHLGVGQGHRYQLPGTKAQVQSMQRKFRRWHGEG